MNKKESGFTLIELLAIITIFSIVSGITGYYIFQTINNSQQKSKDLALNNYKNSARIYVQENQNDIIWHKNAGQEYHTCVSLNTLVEKNLLERKILEDEEIPEYIVVAKDLNGNFLYEKFDNSICNPNNRSIKIPTSKEYCNNITYTGEEQV